MASNHKRLRTFLFALLLAFGLLLIIDRLPAIATPKPAQAKGIIKTGNKQPATTITSQSTIDPIIKLTEYQKRWVNDKSRFKIGKWSRQAGKSFATSLEAVLDCVENPGTTWVFLSAGERQSKELMRTAAIHARAINSAISELVDSFKADDKTEYKQLEILFPNGSRIIGLPANPSTARGHSANILLDEFAFHKDSREIWKALFPTITRGYKIRIISTPQGKKNKFYELWTAKTLQVFDGPDYEHKGERGGYSKHNCTIDQAVTMGLELFDEDSNPIEPEDLRLALNDDEAWHQEYLVEFMDEATAWLPYDLIETVEDARLLAEPSWVERLVNEAIEHHNQYKHLERPPAFEPWWLRDEVPFVNDLYIGFDVARMRHLSVIWVDEERDGFYLTRAAIALHKQPFGVQRNVLFALMRLPRFRRACIDKTGIGADMAERALEIFGASRVEGIDFTTANKETLAYGIKKSFEDRKDLIPADHTIRQSLHSVKRTSTDTGHFRFDADRTDSIGHADHFWAKSLAVQARSKTSGPIHISSSKRRESNEMLKGYE
ncbi:MAG: terminase family protein [Nitrospirota bacterium]